MRTGAEIRHLGRSFTCQRMVVRFGWKERERVFRNEGWRASETSCGRGGSPVGWALKDQSNVNDVVGRRGIRASTGVAGSWLKSKGKMARMCSSLQVKVVQVLRRNGNLPES